jgi:hypothetical protein
MMVIERYADPHAEIRQVAGQASRPSKDTGFNDDSTAEFVADVVLCGTAGVAGSMPASERIGKFRVVSLLLCDAAKKT